MSADRPGCGKCRQAGEKLFLKGTRCRTSKCPVDKEGVSPGQHGKKTSFRKLSEYGGQLREKQKAKNAYGVAEAQFQRLFKKASRIKGATGQNLLSLLERRLDNVVFKLKMASSRRQARQMVVHGHIRVNGRAVRSPSFLARPGDGISLREAVLARAAFIANVVDKRMNIGIKVPEWLELQKAERRGIILRNPERADVSDAIEERLIVELYSK